jgi:hypothetical protein
VSAGVEGLVALGFSVPLAAYILERCPKLVAAGMSPDLAIAECMRAWGEFLAELRDNRTARAQTFRARLASEVWRQLNGVAS